MTQHGTRYYDSQSGKWISPDPIGISGGINLYSYGNSSPVSFFDLDGLSAEEAKEFWSIAREEFPSIPHDPIIVFVESNSFQGSSALMGANILFLNKKYEPPLGLNLKLKKKLMTTIFHEAQHFNQGYLYTAAAVSNGNISTVIKGIPDWLLEIFRQADELTKKYWSRVSCGQ